MSKKNFQAAPKPIKQPTANQITQFEQGGAGQDKNPHSHIPTYVGKKVPIEKTKRLSVDISNSTHLRFKTACSATGRKMTREIEEFILRRTKELEKEAQAETVWNLSDSTKQVFQVSNLPFLFMESLFKPDTGRGARKPLGKYQLTDWSHTAQHRAT